MTANVAVAAGVLWWCLRSGRITVAAETLAAERKSRDSSGSSWYDGD
jgi:hypothetical protein